MPGMRKPRDASADHGRIVASTFRAHPLLAHPHLQTILASLFRPTPGLELKMERFELPDGDFLDLAHAGAGRGPLVLMLHGLSGGFESKYQRGAARRLLRHGFRCVLMQQRGAGREYNRLPQSYHHGASDDVRIVLDELRRREPLTPLYAVGWSLGGNVLLKYLGEAGDRTPLSAAVAASAPFQLHECALHLRKGFARLYQNRMLRQLQRNLKLKFSSIAIPEGSGLNLAAALRARDFIQFDDAATAPLNGFANALDYYTRCANRQFLRHIRRPTLIVHAADDPFMVPSIIPAAEDLAPSVTLELSGKGGHVGFVAAGAGWRPYCWLEHRIAAYLAGLAEETSDPAPGMERSESEEVAPA
jgi:hypothetical protein